MMQVFAGTGRFEGEVVETDKVVAVSGPGRQNDGVDADVLALEGGVGVIHLFDAER